jgi:hypothetical protein
MDLQVFNGSSRFDGIENFNGSSRFDGIENFNGSSRYNGVTTFNGVQRTIAPKPEGMSVEDYAQYVTAVLIDDPAASAGDGMNGLGLLALGKGLLSNVLGPAGKERRRLRRAAGGGLLNTIKRAVSGAGGIGGVAKQVNEVMQTQGISAPQSVVERGVGTALLEASTDVNSEGGNWWEKNKKWALPTGIGVGVLGLGTAVYYGTRKKTTKKRR